MFRTALCHSHLSRFPHGEHTPGEAVEEVVEAAEADTAVDCKLADSG